MALFNYKGLDAAGKKSNGTIEADNLKVARTKLRRLGVFPTEVHPTGKKGGGLSINMDVDVGKYFERVKTKDLAVMTRQLSTLISANIQLVDALEGLIEQTDNTKLKDALIDIRSKVVEGTKLSDACAAHKKVFSELFIHMIAAGEASGSLGVVLERLASFVESQAALKSKIMGAMMYPIIMTGVGLSLVGFLVIYVVPKVTKIFEDIEATLPLPTRVLITVSDALSQYWYLGFIIVPALIYLWKRFLKTARGREWYDSISLRVPLFGKLFRMVAISRFSRTLATLLSSGVRLLNALDITKNIVENTLLIKAIEDTKNCVREGESIAEPLKRSGHFPPLVVHMIGIGEKTGNLETMLERVADSYDMEVDTTVSSLTTLLEPLMILMMGGIVAFIVMSILLPILQLNKLGA
jgi:general secretion pathway protein F